MEERLKQRLVGALVLVSLAVLFIPMLLDTPHDAFEELSTTPSPERPQHRLEPETIPLEGTRPPRLDAEVDRERERDASSADAASRGEPFEAPAPAREPAEAPVPVPAPASTEPPAPPSTRESAEPAPRTESSSARAGTDSPARETSGKQPAAVSGGKWAIQLGSFLQSKNARALRARLHAKGYPAFIESGASEQGEITRVFVGPMSDRERAQDSAEKLRRELQLEGIVVPYQSG